MRAPRTGSVVGLLVVAALCAGCGGKDAKPTDESSYKTSFMEVCTTEDLAVTAGPVMSVSSQPFVAVELRNQSDQACSVRGYPRVTASGDRGQLAVREKRGSIFERKDPGVHAVELAPGEAAVFHVGTATAYDGVRTITGLRIHVPGTQGKVTVPLRLEASRPAGAHAIPLGVTALQHEDDAQQ